MYLYRNFNGLFIATLIILSINSVPVLQPSSFLFRLQLFFLAPCTSKKVYNFPILFVCGLLCSVVSSRFGKKALAKRQQKSIHKHLCQFTNQIKENVVLIVNFYLEECIFPTFKICIEIFQHVNYNYVQCRRLWKYTVRTVNDVLEDIYLFCQIDILLPKKISIWPQGYLSAKKDIYLPKRH